MKLNISIILIAFFGLSIIVSCGTDEIKTHKGTIIKNDINVKVVEVNNDKKDESKDNENKLNKRNPFDFEGKWCSYSYDEPKTIEMMLIIDRISEKKYKVQFKNIIGLEDYPDFNEIGVLEKKDLLIVKDKELRRNAQGKKSYAEINHGLEMGEWDKKPEITLYWYFEPSPETNITAEFKRCD